MKKTIALVLALAMVLCMFAACGNDATSGSALTGNDSDVTEPNTPTDPDTPVDPIEGTTVRVGITDDPGSLGPYASNSMGRIAVLPSIFQGLYGRNTETGELVGVIAESYEHTDATHTIVKIKENVYDTEGNHITAADVAFSYMKLLETGNSRDINSMASAVAISEYEVEFTWAADLSETLGGFDALMMDVYIVSQAAYEASPDEMATMPVGTTGYKVKEFIAGSRLVLERSDNFWQAGAEDLLQQYYANVDVIDFQVIPESSQIAVALETDNIDTSLSVSSNDLFIFEEGGYQAENFAIYKILDNKCYAFTFNCAENLNTELYGTTDSIESESYTAPTSNLNLRLAIAYCFDANGIIKGAFADNAQRVNSFGGNQKLSDYNLDWDSEDYFEYNMDLAREYLDKACEEMGVEPKDITIQVQCGSDASMTDVAAVLQGYILELGVKCVINTNDNRNCGEDPTYWDVRISSSGSTDHNVNSWSFRYMDAGRNWPKEPQLNPQFCHDDKLNEMNTTVRTEAGFTMDNVEAMRDYVNEQCYAVGICSEYYNIVARNFITDIVLSDRACILPGACTYEWNA